MSDIYIVSFCEANLSMGGRPAREVVIGYASSKSEAEEYMVEKGNSNYGEYRIKPVTSLKNKQLTRER